MSHWTSVFEDEVTSSFAIGTFNFHPRVRVLPLFSSSSSSYLCECVRLQTSLIRFPFCPLAILAHPKCLDFWPEVAERARHGGVWQCADCKSCSVCKNKKSEVRFCVYLLPIAPPLTTHNLNVAPLFIIKGGGEVKGRGFDDST